MNKLMFSTILNSIWFQIGALILSFFSPILPIFYILTALVLFDLITAIIRSWKQIQDCKDKNGEEKITLLEKAKAIKSHKLRKTVFKLFTYNLFIALIYSLDYVFGGVLRLAHISLCFISLSEIYSICENLDIINDNNVFSKILKAIRKPIEGFLEKQIGSNEKNQE